MIILVIDDDKQIREDIMEIFSSDTSLDYVLTDSDFGNFESKVLDADIIISDYKNGGHDDKAGLDVFKKIRDIKFAPVIIHSAFINSIDPLIKDSESSFLKIIEKKSFSVDALKKEVLSIVESKEFKIKKLIEKEINKSMGKYYWYFLQDNFSDIKDIDEDTLSRIILRKIIKDIHPQISETMSLNPIEFYEHPVFGEVKIQNCSILKKDEKYYICMNNDCDLEIRSNGKCKAGNLIFLEIQSFDKLPKKIPDADFLSFVNNDLNGHRENKFVFPKTFFFDGGYVDFDNILKQEITFENGLIKLDSIGEVIAKVHSPFSHKLISNFSRYYNRVGTPRIG